MSLLRIVVGYRGEDRREEVPAILYVGFDADRAHGTADRAHRGFTSVELIESRRGQRLRKSSGTLDAKDVLSEGEAIELELSAFIGEKVRRFVVGTEPEMPGEALDGVVKSIVERVLGAIKGDGAAGSQKERDETIAALKADLEKAKHAEDALKQKLDAALTELTVSNDLLKLAEKEASTPPPPPDAPPSGTRSTGGRRH